MKRTCWLIRAGDHSRLADRFFDNSVIGLGWVGHIGDLRGKSIEEIERTLRDSGLTTPGADASELVHFRDALRQGDFVITPDRSTGEFFIGQVAGNYEYLDPSPAGDYCHVRRVIWRDVLSLDLLRDDLAAELKYRRTVKRLTHQRKWLNLAGSINDEHAGRRLSQRRADSSGATFRRPAAQVAAAERLCPGCGMVKAPIQFEGLSNLCVDCR